MEEEALCQKQILPTPTTTPAAHFVTSQIPDRIETYWNMDYIILSQSVTNPCMGKRSEIEAIACKQLLVRHQF